MDPMANIAEQREIAARMIELDDAEARDDGINQALAADGVRLAELVLALDEWRSRGGFDPYKA